MLAHNIIWYYWIVCNAILLTCHIIVTIIFILKHCVLINRDHIVSTEAESIRLVIVRTSRSLALIDRHSRMDGEIVQQNEKRFIKYWTMQCNNTFFTFFNFAWHYVFFFLQRWPSCIITAKLTYKKRKIYAFWLTRYKRYKTGLNYQEKKCWSPFFIQCPIFRKKHLNYLKSLWKNNCLTILLETSLPNYFNSKFPLTRNFKKFIKPYNNRIKIMYFCPLSKLFIAQ